MKVIEENRCNEITLPDNFVGEATCPRCCSVLEFGADNLLQKSDLPYFAGMSYILCPVCKNIFKVDIG
jgi:hypothetical protein